VILSSGEIHIMARGVNEHILIGNTGHDPELHYIPSGTPVLNMTIATGREWKDKQTNQTHQATDWHKIVMFARLAEVMSEYCRKGSQIYVRGESRTRSYEDKDGVKRYVTEIHVRDLRLLGGAPVAANDDDREESESDFQEYANNPDS
jgi:single-strand DNA-binding protein